MPTYFSYTSEATDYLSSRDRRLGRAIAAVEETCGHILRETDEDLFSAVIHHIVGQQISSAAQRTVWERPRKRMPRARRPGERRGATVMRHDVQEGRVHKGLRKEGQLP